MTERAFYREVLESTLPDREAVRRLCLETSEIPVAGHRRKGGHFPVVRWAAGCLLALVLAAGRSSLEVQPLGAFSRKPCADRQL